MHGYRRAVADGATVIVKLDGDGQMDPALIEAFVSSILGADADYTKGNRFFDLREIKSMPLLRRIGNLGLSFMAKASTGYWDLFDPTNGYTAIHAEVARRLPYDSISSRYFFESDILFRLNVMRAKVLDVPMDARYGDEISGLKVSKIVGEFLAKHVRNTSKRIIYGYFLRDMNIASFELLVAVPMIVLAWRSACITGSVQWKVASLPRSAPSCWQRCHWFLGYSCCWPSFRMIRRRCRVMHCIASCCAIRRRARRPTECDAVAAVPARAGATIRHTM